MPVKLIGTIILLILVTIFAGVNLDNKCDITFIFYTFKDIPVFMTVIISFAIGAVFMLPFTFGRGKKKVISKSEDKALSENKEQSKKSAESKTLFDFKIKREASKAESEKGKNESGKKSLFGSGKKNSKEEKADSKSENAASADAESTGAPV